MSQDGLGARRESLRFYDRCRWLTRPRAANEHAPGEIAVAAGRGVLRRLDHAFRAFLRRVRAGGPQGWLRFRHVSRCVTIDMVCPHNGMACLHQGSHSIRIQGFLRLRACSARPLQVDAPLKAVRLTRRGRRWEAALLLEVERKALASSGLVLGHPHAHDLLGRNPLPASPARLDGEAQAAAGVVALPTGQPQTPQAKGGAGGLSRKEFVRERNSCHGATAGIIRKHGLIAVERLKFGNMTRTARRTAEKPGKKVEAKAGMNRWIAAQNRLLLRSQPEYKAA